MENLPTGVEGLDLLMDGGYPRGKSILVTGLRVLEKLSSGFTFFTGVARTEENAYLFLQENSLKTYSLRHTVSGLALILSLKAGSSISGIYSKTK